MEEEPNPSLAVENLVRMCSRAGIESVCFVRLSVDNSYSESEFLFLFSELPVVLGSRSVALFVCRNHAYISKEHCAQTRGENSISVVACSRIVVFHPEE